MQERKMAGPFLPIPGEVLDLLRGLEIRTRRVCLDTYIYMLNRFPVQQDPDVEGEWVMGRIRATHRQIAKAVDADWGWFQKKVWPQLVGLGLVKDSRAGIVELPMLYKKGQSYIIPLEMTRQLNEVKADVAAVKEALASLLAYDYESTEGGKPPEWRSKTSKVEAVDLQSGGGRPPVTSFKGFKEEKDSLSGSNVISGFYRGIGQKRIAKQKRERANNIFKKLRQDGFTPDQIAFAVEWTLENAKEQPYDFSIIEHTIGQAIAAREKEEAESREIQERERKAQEEGERLEREEKEREEIEAYKESLNPDQRAELREKAIAEISESGEYRKEFVDDFLINLRENEILRRKLSEENEADNESEH